MVLKVSVNCISSKGDFKLSNLQSIQHRNETRQTQRAYGGRALTINPGRTLKNASKQLERGWSSAA